MDISKINNQINPFSTGFSQATKDFNKLTAGQKILTVALSSVMGLVTIFLGGIGGFATFKALVDKFTVKVLPKGSDPTADKVDQLSGKLKQESAGSIPAESIKLPLDRESIKIPLDTESITLPLPSAAKVSKTRRPMHPDSIFLIPEASIVGTEIARRVMNMSFDQLIEETNGFPLEDGMLNMLKLNFSPEEKSFDVDLQNEIKRSIWLRFKQMTYGGQLNALNKTKNEPEKFALLAYLAAADPRRSTHFNCSFLEKKCEWPSEELKQKLLPELLEFSLFENGFETSIVPSLFCYNICINKQSIFGGNNYEPPSVFLAKAIGLAIRDFAKTTLEQLNEDINKGVEEKELLIGIQIEIAAGSDKSRLPALMIAPLLPYLKDIPELVSLVFSDHDKNDENGFKDEHAEDLLNILRSSPFLRFEQINIGGMTPEKREEFMDQWVKIWENPREKPLSKELLDVIGTQEESKVPEESSIQEIETHFN